MLKQRFKHLKRGIARTTGILWVWMAAMCMLGSTPLYAQQTTDFLKAEGAPVSVARYLENGLRKAMAKQKQFKLLPNPMAPGMAQLTLGCTLDSSACVARLAKMRSAKVVFHLRVLPFGSRAKAVFRKLDGTSGKTLKSVSYRFRRRQLKKALATLQSKMFGGGGTAPVARPVPVVRRVAPVARRAAPVARRVAPVARRAVVAVRRAAPPVARRAAAIVARRAAPVARRVAPVARRVAPVARRAVAAVRRAVPPAPRRIVPPVRRAAVVARRVAPTPRITATPTPRRVAAIKPSARVEPRTPVASLGTPRNPPTRRVASAGTTKPKPAAIPVWKKPSFWAWICVGVTVAAVGGTIAFGLDAQSKEGEIKQLIERSKQGEQISYKQNVQPLEEGGKSSAVAANVFIGVAAVAAAGAVVLFLLPSPKPAPPKTSRAKTPQAPMAFTDFSIQVK